MKRATMVNLEIGFIETAKEEGTNLSGLINDLLTEHYIKKNNGVKR
jgi:hypothetical protein